VSHANARLTVHGRRLLVSRVVDDRRPLLRSLRNSGSPVSARIGGWPVSEPRRWRVWWIGPRGHTGAPSHAGGCRAKVLQLCRVERRGQDCIGPELGVPARTVSAILRRHQVPYLRDCDPLTGEIIRSSKATAVRYEHDHPGSLVHMDVKKIGRIPDGGGWKAHGRARGCTGTKRRARIGFDFVHSVVDDHSRLAYSEILPDETGPTCAEFPLRAACYLADHGITRIERVMTYSDEVLGCWKPATPPHPSCRSTRAGRSVMRFALPSPPERVR
jgi:Integrase core domain/leucine-zipper of insertion element IS481